jgi:hypothetical protein
LAVRGMWELGIRYAQVGNRARHVPPFVVRFGVRQSFCIRVNAEDERGVPSTGPRREGFMWKVLKSPWLLRKLVRAEERQALALETLVKLKKLELKVTDEWDERADGANPDAPGFMYANDRESWEYEEAALHPPFAAEYSGQVQSGGSVGEKRRWQGGAA